MADSSEGTPRMTARAAGAGFCPVDGDFSGSMAPTRRLRRGIASHRVPRAVHSAVQRIGLATTVDGMTGRARSLDPDGNRRRIFAIRQVFLSTAIPRICRTSLSRPTIASAQQPARCERAAAPRRRIGIVRRSRQASARRELREIVDAQPALDASHLVDDLLESFLPKQ